MKVRWTTRGKVELHRTWAFVAERDVARADRLENEILRRCDSLGKFPRLGRLVMDGRARDLSLTDMQYVIRYRIEDDEILIVGVRHTKQGTP